MSERRHGRRGGLVGPVILIGLGIVLLLNNLGVLRWSVWEVLVRLWPILLIAGGLDLILGRRSIWGALLALVLTFAVLAAALWLSRGGMALSPGLRSDHVAQPLGDASRAELTIDPGIGTLRIKASSDQTIVYEGTVRLARREELDRDYSLVGSKAVATLRTRRTSFGPFVAGWSGQRLWDLRLNSSVPLRLQADLGLGGMNLDLTGVTLEDLAVDQGMGQARVALPQAGRFEARIRGAIGQTVVVIPEGLAAKVRLDTGLARRQVPDEYRCEDGVCTSPGYEAANHRVDLEAGQAIGSLVIRR